MRMAEGCLKRLNTDHTDLMHIHSLTDAEDLAKVEAKDGVLRNPAGDIAVPLTAIFAD